MLLLPADMLGEIVTKGKLELVLFAEASMDQVHIISECLEQFFYFFRAEGKQVEDTGLLF